jgi:hypothetical protein
VTVADDDWLIVTSHDCDIVNSHLEKEPTVEILRAEVIQRRSPDKQQHCLACSRSRSLRRLSALSSSAKRDELEREIEAFWKQFTPSIECVGVDVAGTDQLTLADIEPYQRFDADWVSFSDDSSATPLVADLMK